MPTSVSSGPSSPHGSRAFQTTQWSVVLSAAGSSAPEASRALESLCGTYWFPVYVFIRRRCHSADDAQDLTQGFFARLLEKRDFSSAAPERGRFRTFLLTAVQHYLANEYDKARTQKRGGRHELLPLDLCDAEERYAREPFHENTPEKAYERRWVLSLLQDVLHRLRTELEAEGKLRLYETLKPFLTPDGSSVPCRELAGQLGMSESAVKVAVHRLRRRYGYLLRERVGHTLSNAAEVREEIAFLIETLAS